MDNQEALQRTLNRARRALQILEEEKAGYGIRVPVDLQIELEEKQKEVTSLEAHMSELQGEHPATLPDNLPRHTDVFVGRKQEIARCLEALSPSDRGWGVEISGISGMGKTALALEVAHLAREQALFDAYLFASAKATWLSVEGVRQETLTLSSLDSLCREFAKGLGQTEIVNMSNATVRRRALLDALRGRRALLIWDNLETLNTEEQEMIAEFLRRLPTPNKAIVTSRRPIGESALTIRLDRLSEAEALELIRAKGRLIPQLAQVLNATKPEILTALHEAAGGNLLVLTWTLGKVAYKGCSISTALERLRNGAFIDELIITTHQQNPLAASEMIDSVIEPKVVVESMTRIAINSFNRCQTLGDIAEIPDQLNWIPSPAPKELGNALPQLLDISQDVKAAFTATLSRRSELLNRPINALRKLQNSLAFERNPQLATNSRQITDQWLAILETAQRTLHQTAQQRQEIIQVYIAGNALDPETAKHRFKGRIDIFREIETLSLADQPPVLLLYGGRRAGKTSALKYLPHKVDSTLVPLLIDLQGAASATTLPGLATNLATQIIEAARRLPRRLDLPYPNEIRTDPFIALQNWLAEIERTHPSKRFLLNLDEFERLSEVVEATGSRAPLNFLRNVLQHRRQWILLFSGSHEVAELPSYWNDYLINTRTIRVSFLDEESARELILEPVENFPKIYQPEAVNEIIKLTRCQPYLIQLISYEVVERLNRDIRENKRELEAICRDAIHRVSIADVQAVIPTVLERGDQYFRELWTSLQQSDRNFISRLIQGQNPTAQDKRIVKKLIRKEIITPQGNALQIPLVQRFIEEVLEEENV